MLSTRLVMEEDEGSATVTSALTSPITVWSYIGASALLLATIGTWLVWFSAVAQRSLQAEGIRSARQRAMLEQVERCFDTVVIQRGGGRR